MFQKTNDANEFDDLTITIEGDVPDVPTKERISKFHVPVHGLNLEGFLP